jgi:hypothetical protein
VEEDVGEQLGGVVAVEVIEQRHARPAHPGPRVVPSAIAEHVEGDDARGAQRGERTGRRPSVAGDDLLDLVLRQLVHAGRR